MPHRATAAALGLDPHLPAAQVEQTSAAIWHCWHKEGGNGEVELEAESVVPTFLREYDKLARQCAAESLDSRSFLQQLCELELLDREQRATERRIKAAKFPVTKSLDTFTSRPCQR